MNNKKASVNSYRFIAMYLLIGMVVSFITAFAQDTTNTTQAYNLDLEGRTSEIALRGQEIYDDSETLVQSNQFDLTSNFGDERGLGRNWAEVFKTGFLPTGLIAEEQLGKATDLEKGINTMLIWFRWIILLFAGYELFQMLIRKVT